METSITWNSEDREWRIWTDSPGHAKTIERVFEIQPYRTDATDGETTGRFYLLPAGKYRPFAAKHKMELTDEQRAAMRERFLRQVGVGTDAAILNDSAEIDDIYLDDGSDDSSEE